MTDAYAMSRVDVIDNVIDNEVWGMRVSRPRDSTIV